MALASLALACARLTLSASPELEAVRQALGEIETGASQAGSSEADHVRGSHKEISRYQILPAVWQQYTNARDYSNPARAWSVAQRVLGERADDFRRRTGREPRAVDLYILWNAPGHYAAVGFDRERVRPVIRERALRFAALVQAHLRGVSVGRGLNAAPSTSSQRRLGTTPLVPGLARGVDVALN